MYASRSLCLTQPGDIIQLPNSLRRCLNIINKHYERCGIITTKNVIWDSRLKHIKDYTDYTFSYFFYGDVEFKNTK